VLCIRPQDFDKHNKREDGREQITDGSADLKRDGGASADKVQTDGVRRRVHVGWSSQQIPIVFLEVVSAIEGTLITLT
jgi:hypothetical protein